MVQLQCHKTGCNHEWDYQGKKVFPAWVTCPNCLNKVKLPDLTPEER